MSHDYTAELTEEEYENEKVNIFSAREALRKKQEEIKAFQREVAFEEAQLDEHESAVDEQFNEGLASSLVHDMADTLSSNYDLTEYPEGTEVIVSLIVPNDDGTLTEHSISLSQEDDGEECECDTDGDESSEETPPRGVDEIFADFLSTLAGVLDDEPEPEPTKEEPFKVNIDLAELFPGLLEEWSPNQDNGFSSLFEFIAKSQK